MSLHNRLDGVPAAELPLTGLLGGLQALLNRINAILIVLSAIAAGAAGCVLTWEVAGRYFFKIPSDWQDELSIFLLVGATFCSAAWIQTRRGHVGIDALHHVLPASVDRVRRALADVASLAFCTFFAWKCWALLAEAWEDGQTSDSAWGPPLWIPYGLMSIGMTLLAIQLLIQTLSHLSTSEAR
ncbi:MAG TPA: TRAP transporter small permease [Stellaceae bacterium]|nr:TRAP transporter small permease [Stellaceae bacterium]